MHRYSEIVILRQSIRLLIRKSKKVTRIILKMNIRSELQLIIPKGVAGEDALLFALSRSEWIKENLAYLPERIPFKPGIKTPILDKLYLIKTVKFKCGSGSGIWLEGSRLIVADHRPDISLRIRKWFQRSAQDLIAAKIFNVATTHIKKVKRIIIRDPYGRWASCSDNGTLSFSWRLFMAPEWVIDYVVAHEIAHLSEMNHNPKFWLLVINMVGNIEAANSWLTSCGPELQRYG